MWTYGYWLRFPQIANAEGRISTQRGGRGKQDAETLREREVRLVKEIEKKAASIRDLQDKVRRMLRC